MDLFTIIVFVIDGAMLLAGVIFVCMWRSKSVAATRNLKDRTDGESNRLPWTRMVRVKRGPGLRRQDSVLIQTTGVMDLTDEFRNREGGGGVQPPGLPPIGLCSISDYFASLRPESGLQLGGLNLVKEMDAVLSFAVLKALGERIGYAMLPLLSWLKVSDKVLNSLGWKGDKKQTIPAELNDLLAKVLEATSDLTLMNFGGLVDQLTLFAQKRREAKERREAAEEEDTAKDSGKEDEAAKKPKEEAQLPDNVQKNPANSPLTRMRWGETVNPTWKSLPNPFVVETDFAKSLDIIMDYHRITTEATGAEFKPDDLFIDVPKPINDDLLPGLHVGFGGVLKTQTLRAIQESRTIAILLNRLSANTSLDADAPKFVVSIGGKEVTRPEELCKGLQDTGHTVQGKMGFNPVTFGYGLCIKEDDGTWTNMPWSIILKSGFEDKHCRPTYGCLAHGGLDVTIEGPIVKNSTICWYISQEGMVGWYTAEYPQVPWLKRIMLGSPYTGDAIVRCMGMAGLYATALNVSATDNKLALGGYAQIGVCLDSTAVLEKALTGTMNAYPCMYVARYHHHAIREARSLLARLQANSDDRVAQMQKIVDAMVSLPLDLCAPPSDIADGVRRSLGCLPNPAPFQIMARSAEVCKEIIRECEEQNKELAE